MKTTAILIYLGHFFSSWGDRMWYFAIPLFLLDLEPKSLTLSAAFGFTLACTVLIFGPLIGDWIDRKPRLYCVRITLITQNLAVVLCATLLLLTREYLDITSPYITLVKLGAIILGAIANLSSTGTSIIIQRDWIVVVAGNNQDTLANLNSTTRRIDLLTKILAPVACGQIMAVATLSGGAIFIMSWNAVSVFVEYFLLVAVYNRTPALSKKEVSTQPSKDKEMKEIHHSEVEHDKDDDKTSTGEMPTAQENDKEKHSLMASSNDEVNVDVEIKQPVWRKMFGFVITLKDGWKLYISQPIALPCIGFSFLYMTILGFGYITIAYAYSQCLSELSVGLLQAGAAVTGIVATFIYPTMRKKIGVIKSGIFSATFQILTLIPCVVSIFLAGSPFLMFASNEINNTSTTAMPLSNSSYMSNATVSYENVSIIESDKTYVSELFVKCLNGIELPSSFLSIALLMTGIILARVGLWGFDLVITQLIQENVVERERGIFSGVQTSLNNFMDLLRYILVLALPFPYQFGILIIISCVFVIIGYILYFVYAKRIITHSSSNHT